MSMPCELVAMSPTHSQELVILFGPLAPAPQAAAHSTALQRCADGDLPKQPLAADVQLAPVSWLEEMQ